VSFRDFGFTLLGATLLALVGLVGFWFSDRIQRYGEGTGRCTCGKDWPCAGGCR